MNQKIVWVYQDMLLNELNRRDFHECESPDYTMLELERISVTGEITRYTPETTKYKVRLCCNSCYDDFDITFKYSCTEKTDYLEIIDIKKCTK